MGNVLVGRGFRGVRGAAAVGVMAAVAASCAAPSRRLTLRQVEDPIVLPRRMASASVSPYVTFYRPTGRTRDNVGLSFRMGLTDRLEWTDFLSLRYAFLDDSPGGSQPGAPISLALRAGVQGVGYSSLEGWIVQPLLSLDVWKHIADRWRLWGNVYWDGSWSQRAGVWTVVYDGRLVLERRRWSAFGGALGAQRQLADRIALSIWLDANQAQACLDGFCDWASRGGNVGLTFSYRPWHWLTWSLAPHVGGRYRPLIIEQPQGPAGPVDLPPRRVGWVSISTSFTFYW